MCTTSHFTTCGVSPKWSCFPNEFITTEQEMSRIIRSSVHVVFYESIKRELKTKLICECRCDERLKTKVEESTRLACTVYMSRRRDWRKLEWFFFPIFLEECLPSWESMLKWRLTTSNNGIHAPLFWQVHTRPSPCASNSWEWLLMNRSGQLPESAAVRAPPPRQSLSDMVWNPLPLPKACVYEFISLLGSM